MQGHFKDEPTKIQCRSSNEEILLCFQAGIQNYAVNYRSLGRGVGEGSGRWMLSQNYGSHGWCFRLQLRELWKGVVSEWKGLCRIFHPTSCSTLLLFLPWLLNNYQTWSPLPGHSSGVVRSPWGVSSYFDPKTYSFPFFIYGPWFFLPGLRRAWLLFPGGI